MKKGWYEKMEENVSARFDCQAKNNGKGVKNMKMEVVSSKICDVYMREDKSGFEAELSIVRKGGKYGLMFNFKVEPTDGIPYHEDLLIIDCKYDNMCFMKMDGDTYLMVVSDGMQGLLKTEGYYRGEGRAVSFVECAPCEYDRIEPCKNNFAFLFYRQDKIFCYASRFDEIIAICEKVEDLEGKFLFCTTGNKSEFWSTFDKTRLAVLDDIDECIFAGNYDIGDVFRLRYKGGGEEGTEYQLLFYSYFTEKVTLSPKTTQLSIRTKMTHFHHSVVGIHMGWGDWEYALPYETIQEIEKEYIEEE